MEIDNILITTKEYIPKIAQDKNYATGFEMGNLIHILNLNIAVYTKAYSKDNKEYIYKFYNYFNYDNTEFQGDLLIILYDQNNKHYLLLNCNKNYQKDNDIKKQINSKKKLPE